MVELVLPENFAALRRLISTMPVADETSKLQAYAREQQLTKPAQSLGRLEKLVEWLSAWQHKYPPTLNHPTVCVFAGSHGIAEKGVSAYPPSVNRQMWDNFSAQGAAINAISNISGCRLQAFDMGIDTPTQDFSENCAMSETECVQAFISGMEAVTDDTDLLALGELGIGNTTAASAIYAALYGGDVKNWVGMGTGSVDERLIKKTSLVQKALILHKENLNDPLEILRRVGGREIAAMAGAIISARFKNIPVILDGFICCSAAAVLYQLNSATLDHCIAGHVSAESAHTHVLEKLQKKPVLSLEMRLGEGTGAVLAMQIVRTALETHMKMRTFAEAGVDGKL